jgi:opacity protein-like surface antigen
MKKTLGFLLSVALLVVFLPQTSSAAVTFDLGIKGGASLTRVHYTYFGNLDDSKPLFLPVFGGFLAINLNKTFTLQPEVYYLTQGGSWEWEDEGPVQKEVEKVSSIPVPLLAKIHLVNKGKTIPIVFAGPALDLILSAKGKYYLDGVLDENYDFKEFIKSTNFGLVFGGGVEIMLEKMMVVLEARYNMGLTDLHPDVDEVYKTRTVMVMLGIGF